MSLLEISQKMNDKKAKLYLKRHRAPDIESSQLAPVLGNTLRGRRVRWRQAGPSAGRPAVLQL